jgi:hypothetical protein
MPNKKKVIRNGLEKLAESQNQHKSEKSEKLNL